eukprot:TRINITY_DN24031_c0_g1_i2.p1 TRINITY_DN24031_c0_g1~~TRINITY_DN24031_c0_g1_i2.p1  ORF type:complete len:440 (+),score=57.40 TRINITY_DN24031_c0_g1_i2:56-1321(+)
MLYVSFIAVFFAPFDADRLQFPSGDASAQSVSLGDAGDEWSLELYYANRLNAGTENVLGPVDDFIVFANNQALRDGESVDTVINKHIVKDLRALSASYNKRSALEAIADAHKAGDVDKVASYLAHPSTDVVCEAAETLGKLKEHASTYVPLLADLAFPEGDEEHEDKSKKWMALEALGKIGGEAWKYKDMFLQVLEASHPVPDGTHERHREYMARISLLQFVMAQGPEAAQEFVPMLHVVLQATHSQEAIFVASGFRSGKWGNAAHEFVDDLVKLLSDNSAVTQCRETAAMALKRMTGTFCSRVHEVRDVMESVERQISEAKRAHDTGSNHDMAQVSEERGADCSKSAQAKTDSKESLEQPMVSTKSLETLRMHLSHLISAWEEELARPQDEEAELQREQELMELRKHLAVQGINASALGI